MDVSRTCERARGGLPGRRSLVAEAFRYVSKPSRSPKGGKIDENHWQVPVEHGVSGHEVDYDVVEACVT